MTSPDRTFLLDHLERAKQTLLDAVADLTEEQAAAKPAYGAWSIADCVEHLAVSEAGLLRLISKASAPRLDGEEAGNRDTLFVRRGTDRSRPFQSPEGARPAGRFGSLAEALDRFLKNRGRSREWIEQCQDDLRRLSVAHPVGGNITAYECCILLALHPERHAAQIREIRDRPAPTAAAKE